METTNSLNAVGVEGEGMTYTKEQVHKDMSDMMGMHIQKCMDHITKCFGDHKDTMETAFKSLHDRLDDVESAVNVAEDGPKPVLEIKKIEQENDALETIQKALSELRKSIVK